MVVVAAVVSSAAVAVRMDSPEAVIKSDDDGVTNCDPVPPSGLRMLTVQMSREAAAAAARLSRVGACVCVTTRGGHSGDVCVCVGRDSGGGSGAILEDCT